MSETDCEHCGQMFCCCPDRHREPRTGQAKQSKGGSYHVPKFSFGTGAYWVRKPPWDDPPKGAEAAAEILEAENAKLVAALEKLDKYWFDGKAKEYACSLCDMGGAGYPTNSDGHDTDCIISEAHQLLAEYKKGRGE